MNKATMIGFTISNNSAKRTNVPLLWGGEYYKANVGLPSYINIETIKPYPFKYIQFLSMVLFQPLKISGFKFVIVKGKFPKTHKLLFNNISGYPPMRSIINMRGLKCELELIIDGQHGLNIMMPKFSKLKVFIYPIARRMLNIETKITKT